MRDVSVLAGKDGAWYLLSSTDVIVPANSHLGGVGGGAFHAKSGEEQNRVPYEFPAGAGNSASRTHEMHV